MNVSLSQREQAAVLAGLRLLQQSLEDGRVDLTDELDEIAGILTDGGELAPIELEDIDGLCERIDTI